LLDIAKQLSIINKKESMRKFQVNDFIERIVGDEENISAEEKKKKKSAWFFEKNEDKCRTKGY